MLAAAFLLMPWAPGQTAQTPPEGTGGAVPAAPGATPSTLSSKKPGVIRIGIVGPKADFGQGNSGVVIAETLRVSIIRYLSGPLFEVVPINAMLPVQVDAEVKQKECDLVLYSSLTQKMSGGGLGILKKAMPMASMIPMVGIAAGAAGSIATTAAGAAINGAAGLGSLVKAKSEVTFEYKLVAPTAEMPVLANSAKAKAKQDGEDIVTPLLEQASGAITAELSRRK